MSESYSKQIGDSHSHAQIPAEWLAEFEAARNRPLPLRFRYAFIKTYKPVLDDAPYRSFDTMQEYREWCEKKPSRLVRVLL